MALLAVHEQRDIAEIIDIPAIRRIADAHFSGGPDQSLLLWNLLVLFQWLDAQLATRGAVSRMAA
jgi:hypothetical protein